MVLKVLFFVNNLKTLVEKLGKLIIEIDLRPKNEDPFKISLKSLEIGSNMILN